MTKLREIYYCRHCRQVLEVIYIGAEALVCCGERMTKLEGNTTDAAVEKHVPVIKDLGDSVEVAVGSTLHPMQQEHHIAFIEVLTKNFVYRAELVGSDTPVAKFEVKLSDIEEVREYCNLHGLWKTIK